MALVNQGFPMILFKTIGKCRISYPYNLQHSYYCNAKNATLISLDTFDQYIPSTAKKLDCSNFVKLLLV